MHWNHRLRDSTQLAKIVWVTLLYHSSVMDLVVQDTRCRARYQAPVSAHAHGYNAATCVLYYPEHHCYKFGEKFAYTGIIQFSPSGFTSKKPFS